MADNILVLYGSYRSDRMGIRLANFIVAQLQARGAVGEMIGHAIAGDGRLIASPIEDRVTSLPLSSPPARPVIGMAGGAKKAEAIRAVLRGGWWSGLITDEYCARYALQDD